MVLVAVRESCRDSSMVVATVVVMMWRRLREGGIEDEKGGLGLSCRWLGGRHGVALWVFGGHC